jgi:predicted dehydrogenase
MALSRPTRRTALLTAAAGWLDARSYARAVGANDRVTVGIVGCGGRGRFVAQRLVGQGADVAAACDPDPGQIGKLQSVLPSKAAEEKDFRRLLDRKDVDAVLIATPDHWHALPFVSAVRAGKDVYMEKPTAYTVAESRAMVEAAKTSKSIVQIGTQQKSGDHYKQAVGRIHGGELGAVSRVRFWNVWNNTLKTGGGRSGGLGNPPDGPPPAGVDYDLWLGPAPTRPFNPNRFHWNYAYFWDYSGGMMSGWGVHHVDIIHWAMNADTPRAVSAAGGKFVLTDNRETPDTLDAVFEYPGFTVHGSMYHANARPIEGRDYGVAFYGSKATLVIDRTGYEVWPEGDPKQAVKYPGSEQESAHAKNFLDAVKSRKQPFADLATGHKSSLPCLLANVSFRTGRKLTWDAERERFVGDPEADKFLTREYRKPWAFPA